MSEQKESSVLFSLKELMNLEEDRIRTEEADRAAKAKAEEEAKLAAERAARDAEAARIRAEEERRRAEEQRQREEQARLAAIQAAEVERARLQAEQDARMAAMAAQQQHEQKLEAIRTDKSKKGLRNMLIAFAAVVVIGGGIAIKFVLDSNAKKEAAALEQKKKLEAAEAENKRLTDNLNAAEANRKRLEDAVAMEQDATKKAKLQAELDAARLAEQQAADAAGKKVEPRPTTGPANTTKTTQDKPQPKAACTCKSTDPLCDCL